MKKIAVSVLLATAFAFAQAQDSSSVAGMWKVHASVAGNESDSMCTFTQSGNDLTGTCDGGMGTTKITGKVDGKKITWSFSAEMNGSALTVKYEGTLDAGKMAGTLTVDPYGVSGDFTATPSTEASPTLAPVQARDANSPMAGKWKVHQSIAGNENDSACNFTQTGNDLAGQCGAGFGGSKVTGKIDGKKVTWSSHAQYNGTELTMKYEGTLDAGKVTGTLTIDPMGVSGDFTATAE
jgi:hypothetical protein